MDTFITIRQYAALKGIPFDTAKHQVQRRKSELHIEKRMKPAGGGYERYISTESLAASGLLNNGPVIASEGNRLLACSIVKKKFENLSTTEIDLMDKLDFDWRAKIHKRKTELQKTMSEKLNISRAGLHRDHTKDRRKERDTIWDKMTAEQKDVVTRIFLKRRTIANFVVDCMSNPDLPNASRRSWYRIASDLQKGFRGELILRDEGPKALALMTEPILRDKTHLGFLDMIVGDYWRTDLVVEWNEHRLVRPALSVWVDLRTNMIVGAALSENPNARGVKKSLLQVLTNFGCPKIALMDNGKEYRAHAIVGKEIEESRVKEDFMPEVDSDFKRFEYKGLLPTIGIKSRHALPYNGRAKPVERVFGIGGFSDLAKEFSDYIGGTYKERPEEVQRAIKQHKKGIKKYRNRVTGEVITFCTIEELAGRINEFIHLHNNRPSKGFGMDGKSPAELSAELSTEHPLNLVDLAEVAFAFMDRKQFRTRANGMIEFRKYMYYRADKLWHHPNEDVYVVYDIEDGFWWERADHKQREYLPKSLMVYTLKGKFICEAHFKERVHPTEADVRPLLEVTRRPIKDAKDTWRSLRDGDASVPIVRNIKPQSLTDEVRRKETTTTKLQEEERQRIKRRFKRAL